MTFKTNSATRLCRVVIVAIFALSARTDALLVAAESKELGASSTRYLRAHKPSWDYVPEARAFDVNIPVISKLVEKVSKKPKNEDEVLQLFMKMKLPYQHTKLLENPQFQKWASAVTKGYKKNFQSAQRAMAPTLAAQYGDEALAKMIVSAETMAAKLEETQLQNWLGTKKLQMPCFGL
ncbi:hypothetical protein PHYSODRAFT_288766 [Phytophthora sojae]|uniref:RxLR effector protein n=2 Tax=Phytophthora sojae TaxID=67593 RepID=G5A7M1_PHYSP|nr:hypothetical protein PHYSODRAFT_288766 [Phytophthora sojae]AEK81236.1 Avh354 [Phytophthora sojae]AEK81237.1 Avh354 [Phytophthora sojae]AEK81238.1 Avh354 [Phytophthora sojae]EGZ07897.1 hypothetical protein PHYSODRAFT_288766 [Phytophthora sojae]|eukprot:XP_009536069.1 hypothetical protein PHYSODRAFT_288766 [Phytophthora sojae]